MPAIPGNYNQQLYAQPLYPTPALGPPPPRSPQYGRAVASGIKRAPGNLLDSFSSTKITDPDRVSRTLADIDFTAPYLTDPGKLSRVTSEARNIFHPLSPYLSALENASSAATERAISDGVAYGLPAAVVGAGSTATAKVPINYAFKRMTPPAPPVTGAKARLIRGARRSPLAASAYLAGTTGIDLIKRLRNPSHFANLDSTRKQLSASANKEYDSAIGNAAARGARIAHAAQHPAYYTFGGINAGKK